MKRVIRGIDRHDATLLGITVFLALVAVGNYVAGIYGGAVVASIGCGLTATFLLLDRD